MTKFVLISHTCNINLNQHKGMFFSGTEHAVHLRQVCKLNYGFKLPFPIVVKLVVWVNGNFREEGRLVLICLFVRNEVRNVLTAKIIYFRNKGSVKQVFPYYLYTWSYISEVFMSGYDYWLLSRVFNINRSIFGNFEVSTCKPWTDRGFSWRYVYIQGVPQIRWKLVFQFVSLVNNFCSSCSAWNIFWPELHSFRVIRKFDSLTMNIDCLSDLMMRNRDNFVIKFAWLTDK